MPAQAARANANEMATRRRTEVERMERDGSEARAPAPEFGAISPGTRALVSVAFVRNA